jgi:hypothetical protein
MMEIFFILSYCLLTTPIKEGGKYILPWFSSSKLGLEQYLLNIDKPLANKVQNV